MTCISFTIHKFFDMSLFQRINISKKIPCFFCTPILKSLFFSPNFTRAENAQGHTKPDWRETGTIETIWRFGPAMLARCGATVTRRLTQVKAGEKSIIRGGLGHNIPSLLRSTSSSHLTTSLALNRKMVTKLTTEERSAQLQPLLSKGQWHYVRSFDYNTSWCYRMDHGQRQRCYLQRIPLQRLQSGFWIHDQGGTEGW